MCSHVYFMVYETEECWCDRGSGGCGRRWTLTWKRTPDGKRVPTAWVLDT